MKINILCGLDFFTGWSEEDEKQGFYEEMLYPMFVMYEPNTSRRDVPSVEIPITTRADYDKIAENLFWFLASLGRLQCPACKSIMDYDASSGDPSFGMQSYQMTSCTNPECIYRNIETPEKEQELIRAVFPPHYRYDKDEEEDLARGERRYKRGYQEGSREEALYWSRLSLLQFIGRRRRVE